MAFASAAAVTQRVVVA